MNMVGTHWLWVTPYFSIAASAASGSNFSITTTVAPKRCMVRQYRNGAAWYSGAGDRYTESASGWNSSESSWYSGPGCPIGALDRAGLIPLGRPVVPDEYSMSTPSHSFSIGVGGCWATRSSYDS